MDIQAKLQEGKGAGYARWATLFNLKQMAQTVAYLQNHELILTRNIEDGNYLSELEDNPDGVTRVEYFPKLIVRKSTGPCEKREKRQV